MARFHKSRTRYSDEMIFGLVNEKTNLRKQSVEGFFTTSLEYASEETDNIFKLLDVGQPI